MSRHFRSRARARGRPQRNRMNRTETAYSEVLEIRRLAGEIIAWQYEPVKLRLADNTYYTPDFQVIAVGGLVEFHEVKAAMANGAPLYEDDARVKIKVAAEQHWMYRFIGAYLLPKKAGGGWRYEEFE